MEGDVVESAAELVAGHGAVGGQVDESILLRLEGSQLLSQTVFQLPVGGLQRLHSAGNLAPDGVDGFCVEAFSGDGAGDGYFDVVQSHRANGAVSSLFGGAEVVLVGATIADVLAVDETAGPAFRLALSTREHAFEVVEVGDVPVALAVAAVEDLLDGEERRLVDDGLVASCVECTFEADRAGVVRVTENLRERAG